MNRDIGLALSLTLALSAGCATQSHTADSGADEPGPARPDAGSSFIPDTGSPPRPDADAPTADAGAPDAAPPIDPPRRGSGIPCGAATCETGVSFCLACEHYSATDGPELLDVHCEPSSAGEWPFLEAMETHGCGYPAVFIECDGNEDCAEGTRCVFQGGENGYASCDPIGDGFWGVACESDADCGDELRCGERDPLGYFSPFADVLGWMPRACGMAGT